MADETPEPTEPTEPTPKRSRRETEALPFAEDAEVLDGRAWHRKPLIVLGVILAIAAVVIAIVLAGNDLASDDDGGGGDGSIPAPIQTTTTTTSTTSTTSSTTSSTTTPPPTTQSGPRPGDPCSPEEGNPDCIDPEGDGSYHLIVGGAACLETADDPLACADNDGDGDAGPAVIPT